MAGNSFGKAFVITCFGESHGKCIGVVIDGCPAGLQLSELDIQAELDKRKPSESKVSTPRKEEDKAEILSGVFGEYTTGAPICIVVWNRDVDSEPYETLRVKPRPGHADYTAYLRYGGFNDYRGGGRFSGRVTAAYVMAGAVAKKLLKTIGVEVLAHIVQIGSVKVSRKVSYEEVRNNVYGNEVRCADLQAAALMIEEILKVKSEGDSLGGVVECIALNYPAGVGEPIFDSLDADIAKIMFDIPGVKGVEIGAGFNAALMKGSESNDEFRIRKGRVVTETNNCGGILGGLSNGMPIIARIAFKPTSSIFKRQRTVDVKRMEEAELKLSGKYDPCIVPRAVPVVESCMAVVLTDHAIRLGKISPTSISSSKV
ncbi:MAG: chorismate synthase [Candidatus Bathycorpusculaceae bacterium]